MTTCTATRIIGPAHDRTEIDCDLRDGHTGDHIQRDAFGRGSNVDYAWTRTTLRVADTEEGAA